MVVLRPSVDLSIIFRWFYVRTLICWWNTSMFDWVRPRRTRGRKKWNRQKSGELERVKGQIVYSVTANI